MRASVRYASPSQPEAAPVRRRAEPALLGQHDLASRVDELPHPFEVALAPEGLATLALGRENLVEDVLRRDGCVVEAGQEQRRTALHPGVPDEEVLDRGPLGVAEMERARDVRRWLDDHERRQRGIGGRAGAVRGEDVGRQPARIDARLDVGRHVRPGQLVRDVRHLDRLRESKRPLVQRTNGSWYHLLVRRRGSGRSSRRPGPAPSRRAIGRQAHGSRATFASRVLRRFHRPALAREAPIGRYSSRSSP